MRVRFAQYSSCLLLILIGLVFLIGMPWILKNRIRANFNLKPGSTFYNSWVQPRSGNALQFYLFSVINPRGFVNGDRLLVKQIGPYTYNKVEFIQDIVNYSENGTVNYRERNFYYYNPKLSVGNSSDKLTIVNLAYLEISNRISNRSLIYQWIVKIVESYYKYNLFVEKTVDEVIWGYEDPMLMMMNKFIKCPTLVGLFAGSNGSFGNNMSIDDGVRNTDDFGKIIAIDGHSNLMYWKSALANEIKGSTGSVIPPFRSASDKIQIYAPDLCRSLTFDYSQKSTVLDVPTLLFKLSNTTFLSPDIYPPNQGYCLDPPDCPKSGILEMKTCIPGAPIAVSLPNFNQADQSYRNAVDGLKEADNLTIHLEVEPQTGVVMKATQMIQINAIVTPNFKFTDLCKINKTFIPIGYFKSTIRSTYQVTNMLKLYLFLPTMCVNIFIIVSISIGIVGLLVLSICKSSGTVIVPIRQLEVDEFSDEIKI